MRSKHKPKSWKHRRHIDRALLLRVILPVMALGTLAGVWLVKRTDQGLFYRIIYWLLVPIGLKLVYDGATALF